MNIRILAVSALALATLTGVAIAGPRNGNWDKCPGGFDASTVRCFSRDTGDAASDRNVDQNFSGRHSSSAGLPDDQGGESNPQ